MRGRTRVLFAAAVHISIVFLIMCMTPALGRLSGTNRAAGASDVSGDGVHYLGFKRSSGVGVRKLTVPLRATPLASSVDLSSQLPPVGNQAFQGSCVAWAISYYYKSWSEKREHTSWDISNSYYRYSPSFMYNQINGGVDEGSTYQDAFALLQNKGDVDMAEMPYNYFNYTKQPTAAQLEAAKPYRIPSDWGQLLLRSGDGPYALPNDISGLKTLLNNGKIFIMGIPIYADFPDDYGNPRKAYYDYNDTAAGKGGHAVCICGYDDDINPTGADEDHRGGFKMVNSWGSYWNGNGFLYLSYDFVKRYVVEAWAMGDLGPDDPSISTSSVNSGKPNDIVTITGNNFGTLRRKAAVSFNGTNATSVSITNDSIVAQVPWGATSGPLTVYDWDGKASNSVPFTVLTGFSLASTTPASAINIGKVNVQISGVGFKAGTSAGARLEQQSSATVINATNFVVSSDSLITCTFNLASKPLGKYDAVVKNGDGEETRLLGYFKVTNVCGQGAGASISVLAAALGLISLAGLGRRRRRIRGK